PRPPPRPPTDIRPGGEDAAGRPRGTGEWRVRSGSPMDRRARTLGPLLLAVSMAAGRPASAATPLDEALRLQHEGKDREAQRALRALLPALRAANDRAALARALTAAT